MNDTHALRILINAADYQLKEIGSVPVRLNSSEYKKLIALYQQLTEAIAWAERQLEEVKGDMDNSNSCST